MIRLLFRLLMQSICQEFSENTDRLHIRVQTICLYSGTETWDGPRTLSDMMEFGAETDPLKEYFSDYPANLFCVE